MAQELIIQRTGLTTLPIRHTDHVRPIVTLFSGREPLLAIPSLANVRELFDERTVAEHFILPSSQLIES